MLESSFWKILVEVKRSYGLNVIMKIVGACQMEGPLGHSVFGEQNGPFRHGQKL